MRRRHIALGLGAAFLARTARAQETWPSRPIRLIVPFVAYSGDHDRLIQPKVITQSGDPDHLPGGEARQADGAAEHCGRRS
jgi:tripartite-type tricarboxylate transporter receptor subunit TctC